MMALDAGCDGTPIFFAKQYMYDRLLVCVYHTGALCRVTTTDRAVGKRFCVPRFALELDWTPDGTGKVLGVPMM